MATKMKLPCVAEKKSASNGRLFRQSGGQHWPQVHDRFEHTPSVFFGFLGYGLGLVASTDNHGGFPPYWFGVADLAIRFTPTTAEILHGDGQLVDLFPESTAVCHCGQKSTELVAELDQSLETQYLQQVEQALAWVHQEKTRRMTVARRVPLPPVDLLQTFHCQPSHNTLSKSFYLDTGSAAFVGKCPEVLLEWKPGKFKAFKLSGTYPKHRNPETDALRSNIPQDPKIIAEHQLSSDGFGAAWQKSARFRVQGPNVWISIVYANETAFSVTTPSETPFHIVCVRYCRRASALGRRLARCCIEKAGAVLTTVGRFIHADKKHVYADTAFGSCRERLLCVGRRSSNAGFHCKGRAGKQAQAKRHRRKP